ncbi:MAG TPA: hypothetical protein VKD67_14185 [Acidimicrobiales bacterium]|nr:hypothetical protein [Acidimicrobiales bacterium]
MSAVIDEVRLVETQERPTAVVRRTTTWSDDPSLWPKLLDDVWAFLRSDECPVRVDGHVLTRTRWEIYGDWHDDPAKVETEVYWLLR